jgi:hypothetical protein
MGKREPLYEFDPETNHTHMWGYSGGCGGVRYRECHCGRKEEQKQDWTWVKLEGVDTIE